MHRRRILAAVADYRRRFPNEGATADRFEELVAARPDCFHRDCFDPGHITGSAWLVDATGTRVLMTHHKKLGKWLQLGGHSDGEPDPLEVAVREAREESGLDVRPVSSRVLDLDVHEIPARRDDPAHLHYDVRFVLTVNGSDGFVVSDESHALEWVDIDGITSVTAEESILRMARKYRSGI